MKYTGLAFTPEDTFETMDAAGRVEDATVTPHRVVVDWTEGPRCGNLVATSEDGVTFRGTYGYPTPHPLYLAEFTLYRAANGHVLLFGRSCEEDSSVGGTWIIRLTPA